MTDIASLLDDLFADLGGDGAPSLPTFPTSFPTTENQQTSDITSISHISHTSHSENRATRNKQSDEVRNNDVPGGSARVTSSCDGVVGNVGNVGNVGKTPETLADTVTYDFPLLSPLVGKKEGEWENPPCGRPFLDLNRAGPQRSDWWTGDLMVEVDHQVPPPGDPLPISPSDVRAGVARELRALAEDGREGPAALRDAVEITRAKIRNSEVLAERQAHGGRCHICDERLDDTLPVIAVLSWSRGGALFLHAGCHDVYRARRTALVDRLMASAGYGETLTNGEAA